MPGLPFALSLLLAQARIEARPSITQTVEVAHDASTARLLAPAAATIALAIVACVVLRMAQRQRNNNRQLFKELCLANQLSRSQCRLLRKLSKKLQIANPNQLFLDSELWRLAAAQDMPEDSPTIELNPPASGLPQHELHRLREQLFAPVA